MILRTRKIIFIFLLLFSSTSFAADELPKFAGSVSDYAQVISPSYKSKITSAIQELESKTSAEIVVVTCPSIAPYSEADYAQMLFDKWKIGKKGKDNGVLILLAVKERRWRIHTGYGVEGVLTDALCSQIGRNRMVPYFKEGKFSEGLYEGVAASTNLIGKDAGVSLKLERGFKPKASPQKKEGGSLFLYCFAFFFFLVWNLPWPMIIGLPVSLIFGLAMSQTAPLAFILVMAGYICSMGIRYLIWSKAPRSKRGAFKKILIQGFSGKAGKSGVFGNWGSGSGGSSGGGGGGGGSSGGGGAGGGF